MADLLKHLVDLSLEDQELILNGLSKNIVPVEIDEKIFFVQKEVGELIDNLSRQVVVLTKNNIKWQKKERLKT